MLGDQARGEDIVQDAFLGLFRSGPPCATRTGPSATCAPACSTAAAPRTAAGPAGPAPCCLSPNADDMASAEESALIGEANREVMAALRALPARQREAVVLRYYLDLSEDQAAQAMNVARGTVKSATSRGLAALARMLKEDR